MWGWIVPYVIFRGLATLRRAGRRDLMEKMKEYVEGGEFPLMRQTKWGLNAFTPLTDDWYRHLLEVKSVLIGICTKEVRKNNRRPVVNRHAESVTVPMLHVSSWYDI